MKVGDLVRGRSDGYMAVTWCSTELALVTKIQIHDSGTDITLTFSTGEEVLMEKQSIDTLFEVVSTSS